MTTLSSSKPSLPEAVLPQSAAALVDEAIASGDVHCAAAVYELAGGKQQDVLRGMTAVLAARWAVQAGNADYKADNKAATGIGSEILQMAASHADAAAGVAAMARNVDALAIKLNAALRQAGC